jgi:hypothetical protein
VAPIIYPFALPRGIAGVGAKAFRGRGWPHRSYPETAFWEITPVVDRSEKWRESDAAQRYSAWRDEFDHDFDEFSADQPDDLRVDQPDEISFDIDNVAELLEQLPEELGE